MYKSMPHFPPEWNLFDLSTSKHLYAHKHDQPQQVPFAMAPNRADRIGTNNYIQQVAFKPRTEANLSYRKL